MRLVMLCCGALVALFSTAAFADQAACDAKLAELKKKEGEISLQPDEKSKHDGTILGAHERCKAGEADAWMEADAYIMNT